ncbi:hypothetical protein WK90_26095 [Burkholderia cepacia]|nr:hypothetical protein WJ15_02505 [Burkholderia cepacia]KVV56569.1 hypothetical protein WK83_19870 [Burkholderia cepacia]KVV63544.1 hypothetical protein WK84_27480 [Burkholderia cepacia]KVV70182.1 hypothetical protein WK85_18555 [Burkholderia cepacia]KVV80987.1 hypothetical protein WK86_01745 [Burkholderia cepacia]
MHGAAARCQFLVIDEAARGYHQTRGSSKMEIPLDTLKSLVNQCCTPMALVGSYELSVSRQLARRSPTEKPLISENSTLAPKEGLGSIRGGVDALQEVREVLA